MKRTQYYHSVGSICLINIQLCWIWRSNSGSSECCPILRYSAVARHLLHAGFLLGWFLPERWRWYVPPKRRFTYCLHGAISQRKAISSQLCCWIGNRSTVCDYSSQLLLIRPVPSQYQRRWCYLQTRVNRSSPHHRSLPLAMLTRPDVISWHNMQAESKLWCVVCQPVEKCPLTSIIITYICGL
jgi:hypothetical protein